jgi:ADP-heptose:LPS heptosyltransferase
VRRILREAPVERIVVFRALMLGDLLCALPALRALRRAWPRAEITLVGLPWARELVRRLSHCIDRFIEFPGHPALPEAPCDVRNLPGFLAHVQSQRFDLALQLHGSGEIANPLVACFGARHVAGLRSARAWCPPQDAVLFRDWPEHGHEIERLLALTDHLGCGRQGTHLEFPVHDDDRAALAQVWPGFVSGVPYACIHPGSQLPSRRWLPERFAQVADAIAAQGTTVVLTGSAHEKALVAQVARSMRRRAVDLAGRTSLWSLGALIERAQFVVCNDTGISHIAAALRRPSVVVSSGADVARWAPLDAERHRVVWHATACRPCAHPVCPTRHECARAIEVDEVLHALAMLPRARADGAPGEPAPASLPELPLAAPAASAPRDGRLHA